MLCVVNTVCSHLTHRIATEIQGILGSECAQFTLVRENSVTLNLLEYATQVSIAVMQQTHTNLWIWGQAYSHSPLMTFMDTASSYLLNK